MHWSIWRRLKIIHLKETLRSKENYIYLRRSKSVKSESWRCECYIFIKLLKLGKTIWPRVEKYARFSIVKKRLNKNFWR